MENQILSNLSRGEIAQLKVQIAAAHKNIIFSIPTTEVRYDGILDVHGAILRAQIKYCDRKSKKGCLELQLFNKSQNKKSYTKESIDILLVYAPQVDRILAFYPEVFHDKKTITINLRSENSKFYYKKFIW